MAKLQSSLLSFLNKVLIVIICVGLLGVGMLKIVDFPDITDVLKNWGLSNTIILISGFVEIVLAIAIFYKPSRIKALIFGIVWMLGALTLHLIFKETEYVMGPIFVLILLLSSFFIEKTNG